MPIKGYQWGLFNQILKPETGRELDFRETDHLTYMTEGGDLAFNAHIMPQMVTALILKEDSPLIGSTKKEDRRYIIKCFEGGRDACIPFDMTKGWNKAGGKSHDHYFVDLHQTTSAKVADKIIGGDGNIKAGAKVLISFNEAGNIGNPVIVKVIDSDPKYVDGVGNPSSAAFLGKMVKHGYAFKKGSTGQVPPPPAEWCKKPVKYGTPEYGNRLITAAKILKASGYVANHCFDWVRAVHTQACVTGRYGPLWVGGQYDNNSGTLTAAEAVKYRSNRNLWRLFGHKGKSLNRKKRLFLPGSKDPGVKAGEATWDKSGLIKPGIHLYMFNNHKGDETAGNWHGSHSVMFERWEDKANGIMRVYSQRNNQPSKSYSGGGYHLVDISVCPQLQAANNPDLGQKKGNRGFGSRTPMRHKNRDLKCRRTAKHAAYISRTGLSMMYGPITYVLTTITK